MTDLLERYLQAVGQYLPAATKDDTLAELRANLLEQMDAREEELGRPLNDGDVAAILKQHGKPELVALRYLPQRSLIGPAIYPFYLYALRRAMPLWLLLYAVTIFATSWDGSMGHQLIRFADGMIPSALAFLAAVTIVFVVIDWAGERGKFREKFHTWDPMKLPVVKTRAFGAGEPRSVVMKWIDLTAHCLWMAYVLWIPWHPFWILGPATFYLDLMDVTLAPVWHVFYVALLVLLTVQLVMKVLAFFPTMDGWQKPLKLMTGVVGVVALGYLAFAPVYFVAGNAVADVAKIAAVNHSVGLGLRIALVVSVIGLVKEGWQYVRLVTAKQRLAF